MKKTFSIFFLAFVFCFTANIEAQNAKLSKEEFRSKQQEFIVQRAGLTHEEAKKFFPLYFELQDKKEECNREAWKKMRQGKAPNTTEAEYGKIVEDVIQARIANDNLELEYVRKYKTFLSSKKIYAVQRAEMRFRRELLKGVRHSQKKEKMEGRGRK